MTVYRIAQSPFIKDLSGTGAFLYGGRWNQKGTYALYTAGSIALAYLEFLVHQFEKDTWPKNLKISEIRIKSPGMVKTLDPTLLPIGWNELRYQGETQSVAEQNFRQGQLGIRVPSVIVPREFNVILNPHHSKYKSLIEIVNIENLELDRRFGIS